MPEVNLQILPGISIGFGGGDKIDGTGFGQTVAAINQSIKTVTDILLRYIVESQYSTKGVIDYSTDAILQAIENSRASVVGNADNNLRVIEALIQNGIRDTARAASTSTESIAAIIANNNGGLVRDIGSILGSIINPVQNSNQAILAGVLSMQSQITAQNSIVSGVMQEVLDFLKRKIEYVINNTIVIDDGVFGTILDRVRDILGDQNVLTRDVVKVFDRTINETLTKATEANTLQLTKQVDSQASMAKSLEKIAARKSIFEGEGPTGPAGDYAIGVTIDTIRGWFKDGSEDLSEAWDKLMESVAGTKFSGALDDDCLLPLLKRGGTNSFAGWLAVTLTTAMSWGVLPFQMATVQANRQLQGFRTCFPDQILPPPTLRDMHYLLGYPKRDLVELFQRQGWSRDDANIIMQTWETVPDLTLLFTMYFREEIGKQELESELRKHGFRADMVKSIIDVSSYIPPVQDLITMSVRDVFDEATVRANRQSEDYPPEFTKWMKLQGVKEDWAVKYWQAHWRLPSETMGFEMFHRDIITEQELKGLMKSLDIMPGWRDRLIKLSYNPLTRVDVRRMHSVGVLTEQEVDRAYRDIGYSPENARRLTEFTVKLNKDEGMATADVASDLTKSNILGFYKDGTITREVAFGLLLQEGTNAIAAELLLKSADFDIERADRKALADIVIMAFKNGRYTFDEALREIENRGFTAREKDRIALQLEMVQAKESKLPSRTDLDQMYKRGVIDSEVYIATLQAQGYSRFWSDRYLENANYGREQV